MRAEATLALMMLLLPFGGVWVEGVAACGGVGSVNDIDDVLRDALIPDEIGILGGDGLRVRSVDERRAFSCIILIRPFVPDPAAIISPQ